MTKTRKERETVIMSTSSRLPQRLPELGHEEVTARVNTSNCPNQRSSVIRTRCHRSSTLWWNTHHHFILVLLSTLLCSVCVNSKVYNVHWNTSNPIFRIDNTDHIIDVNRDNLPYDQVNIICPVYAPGTKEEDAEKYIIYNVSKEEYDTCRITNPNPRIIAVCDKPYKLMYFTITFRSFTPQPGGLEFRPGQDYYFISTSSRDDLHRRVGGRCLSENMKVVFKVCCHPGESSLPSTTGVPALAPSLPRLTTPSNPPPPVNPIMTMITRRPLVYYTSSAATKSIAATLTPPIPTNSRYPHKKYNPNNQTPKPPAKKNSLSEKHPNEVLTEELTSGVGWWRRRTNLVPALLIVVLFSSQIWR